MIHFFSLPQAHCLLVHDYFGGFGCIRCLQTGEGREGAGQVFCTSWHAVSPTSTHAYFSTPSHHPVDHRSWRVADCDETPQLPESDYLHRRASLSPPPGSTCLAPANHLFHQPSLTLLYATLTSWGEILTSKPQTCCDVFTLHAGCVWIPRPQETKAGNGSRDSILLTALQHSPPLHQSHMPTWVGGTTGTSPQ